ncbi:polyribonucleotide nucleotidyltransferase [Bacilli bacterium PM5-3]|nr:polyribonucleotide nucleotidyltransferase [Bacilli bacterium PM5-3]MDH6604326.1 polyribonucleotide nucleotidyltransferase [Bacilli bacterium PM5-9]
MKNVHNLEFCGRTISIETGEIAKQANGAVLVRYDDTVILTTAVASKKAKDIDFFPLTVTFEEKLYSVGKIPGGFLKREGRPSEFATLSARLIDRPIRPLFADGFRNDVQIVNTVLSVEQDACPDMMAMLGSSLALCISDIPFEGPIAGVHVGRVDGELIINPSVEETEKSDIELAVAGTKEAINMVEAGAKQVSEEDMLEAIMFGHEYIKVLCEFQESIAKEIGKEKMEVSLYEQDQDILNDVRELAYDKIKEANAIFTKQEKNEANNKIVEELVEIYENKEYESDANKVEAIKQVKEAFHTLEKEYVRKQITVDKIRPDGRNKDEIRPLNSQVDLLPRVHGSAMFTRGETQCISITTLGALNEYQIIDGINEEDQKRFMLHYNFPPFSVGETGRMGAPGRREIGHGALGERALAQVMPDDTKFPYTVRVVSEIVESNGSTSQASICAGTMSLMAAGVPIEAPVAGIAMGLIKKDEDYTILSDIQGLEDHLGDMDFKVAGTEKGITALQMDIKITGINEAILKEALAQAKVGRKHILENMLATINQPREDVSKYAPKMETFSIDPKKIKDVIGRGGEMIDKIIEASNDVKIDIDDDGKVVIYHTNREDINKAKEMIENIVKEAQVGEIYEAKVVRIEKFGAFVELFKGTDALLHVSKISHDRVEKVEDALKLGDIVKVKVMEIDDRGRVNVSAKALIEKPKKEVSEDKKEDA